MASDCDTNTLDVTEATSRFPELVTRVQHGERFVITRRGRPVLGLVPPDQATTPAPRPAGLATIAGALAHWYDLDETVQEIYAARREVQDRAVPETG